MDNHPQSSRIRSNRGRSRRVPITRLATAPANPETPFRLRSPDMYRRQVNSVKQKSDFLEFTFYALGGIGH